MKLVSHQQAVGDELRRLSRIYKSKKHFCDLGCGRGEKTKIFAEHDRKAVGIDYKKYKELKGRDFEHLKADIFDNGLKKESFDLILSYDVIEHLEEPERLIKEAWRLLKKDGIFILSTPNVYRLSNMQLLAFGVRK